MNRSSKATFLAITRHIAYLALIPVSQGQRMPRKRTYLVCPPEHFVVEYAINPWMDTTTSVDGELARKQWEGLREALVRLGHDVHVLSPEIGLPDMVYAANGAFVVDGIVYGARFKHRSEEHTSELQSLTNLVCRLLLEKKKKIT